jgi:hypothetical protein
MYLTHPTVYISAIVKEKHQTGCTCGESQAGYWKLATNARHRQRQILASHSRRRAKTHQLMFWRIKTKFTLTAYPKLRKATISFAMTSVRPPVRPSVQNNSAPTEPIFTKFHI